MPKARVLAVGMTMATGLVGLGVPMATEAVASDSATVTYRCDEGSPAEVGTATVTFHWSVDGPVHVGDHVKITDFHATIHLSQSLVDAFHALDQADTITRSTFNPTINPLLDGEVASGEVLRDLTPNFFEFSAGGAPPADFGAPTQPTTLEVVAERAGTVSLQVNEFLLQSNLVLPKGNLGHLYGCTAQEGAQFATFQVLPAQQGSPSATPTPASPGGQGGNGGGKGTPTAGGGAAPTTTNTTTAAGGDGGTGAVSADTLANTGPSNVKPLAGVGAAAVLLGVGITLAGRRRTYLAEPDAPADGADPTEPADSPADE